jgi:acylpyruvate hydrolase
MEIGRRSVDHDFSSDSAIFSVVRTIAIISEFTTLLPGDLIAMGTPSGVGYPRTPPVFLAPGDIVEVEIEGNGILRNPIADERVIALGVAGPQPMSGFEE